MTVLLGLLHYAFLALLLLVVVYALGWSAANLD